MDDLVERLQKREHHFRHAVEGEYDANLLMKARFALADYASRITALETSLAEAEGRVIAEVVAWLRGQADWHDKNDDGWSGFDRIAQGYREAVDALETGEWRNAQSV